MARERMVTRTVKGTSVKAIACEIPAMKMEEKTFIMGADFIPAKAIEQVRKVYENANTSIVAILSMENVEQLYGMTEDSFIANATPIPPRGEGGRTRERKVTRTVIGYKVHTFVYNVKVGGMEEKIFTVGADFAPDKASDYIRKHFENDEIKVEFVKSCEKFEQLYEMSEKKFIDLSEKLDPRTTKTEDTGE